MAANTSPYRFKVITGVTTNQDIPFVMVLLTSALIFAIIQRRSLLHFDASELNILDLFESFCEELLEVLVPKISLFLDGNRFTFALWQCLSKAQDTCEICRLFNTLIRGNFSIFRTMSCHSGFQCPTAELS